MIIIKFHQKIDSIKAEIDLATPRNDKIEMTTLEAKMNLNRQQIIGCIQITKHFYVQVDCSIDIKPKIANLVFERAMSTDFQPAIGMYGELLRCFRQIMLGMKLVCTKVTWLELDKMISEALFDALMRLQECGEFPDKISEIIDMVFASPNYSNQDLIRCF